MSQNPNPDPCLECHVRRDLNCPESVREHTTTPVERPFTVTQAQNQCLNPQEPLKDMAEVITGGGLEEGSNNLGPLLPDLPELPLEPQDEISNPELCTVLLSLARNNLPQPQKRHRTIREPNPFSGGSPDEL